MLCRKNELLEHQQQCDFASAPCLNAGCGEQVCARSMPRHKEQCLMENVRCPNRGCPQSHLRKGLSAHQDQCAFRVVPCGFHKYGCMAKGSIAVIEEHTVVAIHEHMLLVCNILDYHHRRQLHEKRISCPKKKFKCIVHHFVQLVKKQVIDVDLDFSWKLKIWPNGEDRRHRGYVSIRLFSREASPTFRVEGPYTLCIVNHLTSAKNIVKMTEATSREWADSVRGWGFPAFAKVEDILNPEIGFLNNDQLVVEVEVMVSSAIETVEYQNAAE